jgi:hypothetical protein
MRAIYEDNGSGKLTGAKLQQLAAQLPPEAEILNFTVSESQTDGWYWSIKARVPEVPSRPPRPHHAPGMRGAAVKDDRGIS